jgi:hypothetical protein
MENEQASGWESIQARLHPATAGVCYLQYLEEYQHQIDDHLGVSRIVKRRAERSKERRGE